MHDLKALWALSMLGSMLWLSSGLAADLVTSGQMLKFEYPSDGYVYFWNAEVNGRSLAQGDQRTFTMAAPYVSSKEEMSILRVSLLVRPIGGGCPNMSIRDIPVYALPECGIGGAFKDAHGAMNYTYTGRSNSTMSYQWTVDGRPVGSNSPILAINWSAYDAGGHILKLNITRDYREIVPEASHPTRTAICQLNVEVIDSVIESEVQSVQPNIIVPGTFCQGIPASISIEEMFDIYAWEVTDDKGRQVGGLSQDYGPSVIWKPPLPGRYTISVNVSSRGIGSTANTSVLVESCMKPGLSLVKGCRFRSPVKPGDLVTYTYQVNNIGNISLKDINLTDTHSWGPSSHPVYISGDDGDGLLNPEETWHYEAEFAIPNPELYIGLSGSRLSVMSAEEDHAKLIEKLQRMQKRLELELEEMKEQRSRFDMSRSQLHVSPDLRQGASYTSFNYTYPYFLQYLNLTKDDRGAVRRSEFHYGSKILVTEYSPDGIILSDTYRSRTEEYLCVEYNKPARGFAMYTVIDGKTKDILIIVLDPEGRVLETEFRKLPGTLVYKEKITLSNVARVDATGLNGELVSDMDSYSLEIEMPLPELWINKSASLDPALAGELLTYTIRYGNKGDEIAHGVEVREEYDRNVTFLSSSPEPIPGANNIWNIGDLDKGSSGVISILVRVKDEIQKGAVIENSVSATCEESVTVRAEINTTVENLLAVVDIEKVASKDYIGPGGELNYSLIYRNTGPGNAANVTVEDVVDSNLIILASTPLPTRVWIDALGTHLWWDNRTMDTQIMRPGEQGSIELKVVLEDVENPKKVYNRYRVGYNGTMRSFKGLETVVIDTLFVRKTANKKSVSGGEDITYTIFYGNEADIPARKSIIIDTLPDVDYLYASPEPTSQDGNILTWNIGDIPPHTNGTIGLTVKTKVRLGPVFHQAQSVTGEGFIRSSQRMSTARNPIDLINHVNITAYYGSHLVPRYDSDSESIELKSIAGAQMDSYEHGSGYYERQQLMSYNASNRTIRLDKEIFARYGTEKFMLPGNQSVNFKSLWSDRTKISNDAREEVLSENYLYAKALKKESSFMADDSQSMSSSLAELHDGTARISFVRGSPDNANSAVEISDAFYGDFMAEESIDSYGEGISYSKNLSGQGFVSSDQRAGRTQRTYEYGSGFYQSDQLIDTGVVHKRLNLEFFAFNRSIGANSSEGGVQFTYGSKWNEGMQTHDPDRGSSIIERISSAQKMDKEVIMEPSSLALLGNINGTIYIRATLDKEQSRAVEVEQMMTGNYSMDTSISIHRPPKYLRPHMNVTKRAKMLGEDIVLFTINITNDGNRTLGSVDVVDILQPGLIFINSSLKPKVDGRNIKWSLLSLGIGRTQTIDMRVKISKPTSEISNTARASAEYGGRVVSAEAYCRIMLDWLSPSTSLPLPIKVEAVNQNITDSFISGGWKPPGCMGLNGTSEINCFEETAICCNGQDESCEICL